MIRRYSPDTFGVQEASAVWMKELSKAFPDYAYVGESRDGKGTPGETSAVFYKKDKFKLIDGGTKWLSDTPEVEGSKYSAAAFPRVMSYALLENKADGVRFFHVNTHLDHMNLLIMKKQAEVLMNEISKLPDHPVILTGDFNCVPRSIPYNLVVTGFEDSSAVARKADVGSTFHGNENIDKVIDFIFFEAEGGFEVESYKVCNEKINGKFVSDHHPVYAEYVITK
jgi:endonuclease/exonuclease/phosphatase family metal-dependent hydrolase